MKTPKIKRCVFSKNFSESILYNEAQTAECHKGRNYFGVMYGRRYPIVYVDKRDCAFCGCFVDRGAK